jgi:hypothetical protein
MAKKSEKQSKKSNGLWIPYPILNIPKDKLGFGEKVLLAHIYSFGQKGCWQGNETLGKMFFVTERTISTWVAKIKQAGCILWVHPKGRYRTIWAKSHPDVIAANALHYMGEEISKEAVVTGHAAEILQRRNLPGYSEEICVPTTKNDCNQVRRNFPHTNNTSNKDTNTNTHAVDLPLPAGGQASQLLKDRKAGVMAQVEQQTKSFGLGARRRTPELTPAERERRRQAQKRALLAGQPTHTGAIADAE